MLCAFVQEKTLFVSPSVTLLFSGQSMLRKVSLGQGSTERRLGGLSKASWGPLSNCRSHREGHYFICLRFSCFVSEDCTCHLVNSGKKREGCFDGDLTLWCILSPCQCVALEMKQRVEWPTQQLTCGGGCPVTVSVD